MTSVLIVDDEPAVRELMVRWVTSLGLQPKTAANADEALARLRDQSYDLAVIDVMMPGRDGLWLAGQMRRDHPNTAVVIATAYTELLGKDPETPVADLLVKPFQRDRFALAVERGRTWRKQTLDELRWHDQLTAELRDRVADVSVEIARRYGGGASEEQALAELLSERAPDVAAHGERVARFARSVATRMNCDPYVEDVLVPAARFHDLGHVAMPEALLSKPSPLSPAELALMRLHVEVGTEILASTQTLQPLAPIVMASHEWIGGGGYPRKLAGAAIPLASRIISVVDAYDSMTQARPLGLRFDSADAVTELLRCRDVQFDGTVVEAFLEVLSRH